MKIRSFRAKALLAALIFTIFQASEIYGDITHDPPRVLHATLSGIVCLFFVGMLSWVATRNDAAIEVFINQEQEAYKATKPLAIIFGFVILTIVVITVAVLAFSGGT